MIKTGIEEGFVKLKETMQDEMNKRCNLKICMWKEDGTIATGCE